MDAITFACIDCDVWVGSTPVNAQAHTDEMGTTQADLDAGADAHDSFYVVNTTDAG